MKKTIVLALILAAISGLIAIQTATASAAGAKITGCPPGCESQLTLSTGVPGCTGVWCGPLGSSFFTCDRNGEFTVTCLCAGTYYFCPDCIDGVYVGTVSGAPSGSFATGPYQIECPCN